MKYYLSIAFCIISINVRAQLVETKVDVAPQFRSVIDTGHTVMLPDGYQMSVYWTGKMIKPRFMAFRPDGRLFVADLYASTVFAVMDTNNDGIADSIYVATPHTDSAHSIAFYKDALYVGVPNGVRKFRDPDGGGLYNAEDPFISGIGDTGYYNHFTRTLLFDTADNALYLSVGASCNACRPGDTERATILRFNIDGTGKRVYATGLRNALGLALQPYINSLWATNADRDNLGPDDPPEIITQIRDGGFYGWPLAYGNHKWDDFSATTEYQAMLPITAADSQRVNSMDIATIQLHAHSTPMSIMFYRDNDGNSPYALVAIHGSSQGGRSVAVGYKVVRMYSYFDSMAEHQAWAVEDFLTGFLTDSINYKFWGRPCGLAEDTAGNIYLSSDQGLPVIYRISKVTSAVHSAPVASASVSVFPNPASDKVTISCNGFDGLVHIALVDLLGRSERSISDGLIHGDRTFDLATDDLPAGLYALRLRTASGDVIRKLVIRH